jgi:SAM-dependent methyltransferase
MDEPFDAESLAELDPTGRFTNRADDYHRYRPDYPAAGLDAVLDGLGPPDRLRAADVGAGTGISARQLADRGVHVLAIEPNAAMRAAASPHPGVRWRDGTAEATGLPDGSLDLVLCAQAFHWFRVEDALHELHRVLVPGGRLALMWNTRSRDDPLTLDYIAAIHAVSGEHPAELMPFEPAWLTRHGEFTDVDLVRVPHVQTLDLDGLIGRATSASYVPRDGERFDRLRALLVEAYHRHSDAAGLVQMRYVTEVHRARRV